MINIHGQARIGRDAELRHTSSTSAPAHRPRGGDRRPASRTRPCARHARGHATGCEAPAQGGANAGQTDRRHSYGRRPLRRPALWKR